MGQYSSRLSQSLQRWQHVSLQAWSCSVLFIDLLVMVFFEANIKFLMSVKDFYLATTRGRHT